MNSILLDIVKAKKDILEKRKKIFPVSKLEKKASGVNKSISFKKAIEKKDRINIIAEIKKATPVYGVIKEDFDPIKIVKDYEAGGACAVSVLTEEKYFLGNLDNLSAVKTNTSLPVLRKDFIFDEYQLYEAKAYGADAVLLISALSDNQKLKNMIELAKKIKLDALVEIHDEGEIDKVLNCGAEIIGINSRNLNDFKVDLSIVAKIYPKIPKDKIVVAESGIRTPSDIKKLLSFGINTFLIGNTLMTSTNIKETLEDLRGIK
ncbi:MAG: indole-3-glycerol phosphate synthase TrpC [Elusimicrobia bacterium]|nr:indole-3-glycerol phosphate synthase TrpC [Elusimicrobiota bacterium]